MNERRHAFLIMAHKNPRQLKTLLSLLDHPRVDLYVHLDKKSPVFDPIDLSLAVQHSRIFFVPRMAVVWGSKSQIKCEFRLIEAALTERYEYYHLLSGLDLPLKKIEEILSFFDEHGGKEFVSFESKIISDAVYQRASLFWPFQGARILRPILLPLQNALVSLQKKLGTDRLKHSGITLYKGANWFSCTYGYLSLLLCDKEKLLKLFSYSFCCDELFLQTHLMTTEYKDRLYDLSFSDSCTSIQRLIDWNRGNPYTFRAQDQELLLQSKMLFARKFDEKTDSKIIEIIAGKLK